MIQRLFDIDSWKVATTKLDKEHKRLQESLTAIGNGYMGMRGNFEEGYSGDSHVGTYLAGVWYQIKRALVGGKMVIQIILEKSLMQLILSGLIFSLINIKSIPLLMKLRISI